jgi:hypothetical protein
MVECRREPGSTREWCPVASRTVPHTRVSRENSITKISVEEHDFFRYKHDMPPRPRSTMNKSLQHIHVAPDCACSFTPSMRAAGATGIALPRRTADSHQAGSQSSPAVMKAFGS